MIKRKVRYNCATDSSEQVSMRYRWTVAILNDPREIGRIKERFYRELSPCDDERINYKGLITRSRGLHVLVFSFSSEQGQLSFDQKRKIYDSLEMRFDRNLTDRDEDKWEAYVRDFSKS